MRLLEARMDNVERVVSEDYSMAVDYTCFFCFLPYSLSITLSNTTQCGKHLLNSSSSLSTWIKCLDLNM